MIINKRTAHSFFPPIILMSLIFILSSIPAGKDRGFGALFVFSPTIQNFVHIPLYAALSLSWILPMSHRSNSQRKIIWFYFYSSRLLAVLFTVLFGIFDEFHQAFVPGRYCSAQDILLNVVGAIVGVIIFQMSGLEGKI
jgi:VanZ family protein